MSANTYPRWITYMHCLAYPVPDVHWQNMRLCTSAQKPLQSVCDLQGFPTGFRISVSLGILCIQPWAQTPHP